MKRGDLLRYEIDGSLWIVEWADDKWVKIVGVTHPILFEESGLEVISENR
tara:strand:+ start:356 stop:505 length:150 start_codon:yes stop_codon:yes gene_type:complete